MCATVGGGGGGNGRRGEHSPQLNCCTVRTPDQVRIGSQLGEICNVFIEQRTIVLGMAVFS